MGCVSVSKMTSAGIGAIHHTREHYTNRLNWIESNRGDGIPHQIFAYCRCLTMSPCVCCVCVPNIHCSQILRHDANRVYAYQTLETLKIIIAQWGICFAFIFLFLFFLFSFGFIVVWCVSEIRVAFELEKSTETIVCARYGRTKRTALSSLIWAYTIWISFGGGEL